MENKIRISVLMIMSAAMITACGSSSSSSQVTAPEADAYEYKGVKDPLMATSGADRAGELASRFDLVQGRQ